MAPPLLIDKARNVNHQYHEPKNNQSERKSDTCYDEINDHEMNVEEYIDNLYYDGLVYSPVDNNLLYNNDNNNNNNTTADDNNDGSCNLRNPALIGNHYKRKLQVLQEQHQKFKEMYDYNELQAIRDVNVELRHALETNRTVNERGNTRSEQRNSINSNNNNDNNTSSIQTAHKAEPLTYKDKNNTFTSTTSVTIAKDPELNQYYYEEQRKVAAKAAKEEKIKETVDKSLQEKSKKQEKQQQHLSAMARRSSQQSLPKQESHSHIKVKRPHTHTHKLHSTRVAEKEIVNTPNVSVPTIRLRSTTNCELRQNADNDLQQTEYAQYNVTKTEIPTNVEYQATQTLLRDPLMSDEYNAGTAVNIQSTTCPDSMPTAYNYNDIELSLNELARPSLATAFSTYVVRMPNESEPQTTYASNDEVDSQHFR